MADANSFRLERKPGVRERIEYLARQAQERIAEKRVALEEQLWAVLEGDIGDFWETYEAAKTGKDGKLETDQESKMLTVRKQRPKLINDLPPEFRKLIEDVTVDRNGNVIQKLYSKAQANRDLREILNIDGRKEQEADDVSRLSDAELVRQLADQAKQLGAANVVGRRVSGRAALILLPSTFPFSATLFLFNNEPIKANTLQLPKLRGRI